MNETLPKSAADLVARRDAARALVDQGHALEAERAFAELLRDAPDDADALNFLAICTHGRNRVDEALDLLARARSAHPDDATTLTNLGVLYREQNRLAEAHAALTQSIRVAPDLFVARLRLGEVLAALGRVNEALPMYFGAIMAAQDRGQWLGDATTAPGLRPLVRHAMRAVASGRRALFSALLNPLREHHGGAALARVEKCLAIYLGELRADYPDPRQQPKFLYFPDLPTTRFFNRELFPWYTELEAHAGAIREEMHAVLTEDQGFEPFLGYVDDPQQLQNLLRGHHGTPAWNAFFFYRHGVRNDANASRCPHTITALDAAPLCRVRAHAPEVCFSVLKSGSHIQPHHGVTNTRVVTHLALVVPDACALVVGGEQHMWQEGACFSFDDTFEHEAYNRSADTRVVMLLDVWNPYLSEVERTAIAELIGGIGDFNRDAAV